MRDMQRDSHTAGDTVNGGAPGVVGTGAGSSGGGGDGRVTGA